MRETSSSGPRGSAQCEKLASEQNAARTSAPASKRSMNFIAESPGPIVRASCDGLRLRELTQRNCAPASCLRRRFRAVGFSPALAGVFRLVRAIGATVAGHGHSIAPFTLGKVQRIVGRARELLDFALGKVGGEPDAEAGGDAKHRIAVEAQVADGRPGALAPLDDRIAVAAIEHGDELLATEAGDEDARVAAHLRRPLRWRGV